MDVGVGGSGGDTIHPIVDEGDEDRNAGGGSPDEPRVCVSPVTRVEVPCEVNGLVWVSSEQCYVDPAPVTLEGDGSGGTFRCYLGGPEQTVSGVSRLI